MKLRSRLYLFSLLTVMVTVLYMLFSGVIIIDKSVSQLNLKILNLECERGVNVISDAYKALDDSGLSGMEACRKSIVEDINSRFKNFKLGRTGGICLISPDGSSFCAGGSKICPPERKLSTLPEGSFDFTDASGASRVCAFKSAPSGWKVAVHIGSNELSGSRTLYLEVVSLVGILVLAMAMGTAYYFSRRLSTEVGAMLDIVRRIAKGEHCAMIETISCCDEHRELQEGINSMIDNLRIRDMDRESAEEEARKHQKLESIGILAGGIAHDFNNLLTAIRGNLQLAQMFNTNSDAKLCLSDCEKATIRAMDLTQQLLSFAKGGAPIKATSSIAELIRHNANFILRGSKSKCEFDFAHDLKPVDIDAGQIGQAIDNILINANQAMPEGGIIHIRAENIGISGKATALPLKPGEYVKVSIADQGIGIPKANIQKVFDPFFTTKANGSGLGLSTSYSIIKKHGGSVSVDSEHGVGTIFFIHLPASSGKVLKEAQEEERRYTGGGKVLVMDDQESIRNLLEKMLSVMNCKVDSAENGTQAIEKFIAASNEGSPFEIVFMDLTIPGGMGGKDTMAALLEICPEVIAVVASGYSNDPVMANYQEYGFKGRLDKPFKMQDLSSLVRKLMKAHRASKAAKGY